MELTEKENNDKQHAIAQGLGSWIAYGGPIHNGGGNCMFGEYDTYNGYYVIFSREGAALYDNREDYLEDRDPLLSVLWHNLKTYDGYVGFISTPWAIGSKRDALIALIESTRYTEDLLGQEETEENLEMARETIHYAIEYLDRNLPVQSPEE